MRLENLINPELCCEIKDNVITFEEKSNIGNKELKEVIVKNLPDRNIFVFSTDKSIKVSTNKHEKRRNQFLNNENDKINKRCDGAIIHYDNNYIDIIFCELKSQELKPIQYETQLINTKLFVDYLVSLFNTFYSEEGKIEIRKVQYILFYYRAINQHSNTRNNYIREEVRPILTNENMKNYPESIIKCRFQKSIYNYIEWQELLNKSK